MNELVKEARSFAKDLDVAADAALARAKEILEMDIDPEHKNLHRLLAVQVEAAKLILIIKAKYQGIEMTDEDGTMKVLFERMKVEYKETSPVISRRPETFHALTLVPDDLSLPDPPSE